MFFKNTSNASELKYIIATPANQHLKVYKQLKAHNINDCNILIEKPVGTSIKEFEQMNNCFTGLTFLYDNNYKELKQNLYTIGNIQTIQSIRASLGPRLRADNSIISDYMIHDIYLINDILNEQLTHGT